MDTNKTMRTEVDAEVLDYGQIKQKPANEQQEHYTKCLLQAIVKGRAKSGISAILKKALTPYLASGSKQTFAEWIAKETMIWDNTRLASTKIPASFDLSKKLRLQYLSKDGKILCPAGMSAIAEQVYDNNKALNTAYGEASKVLSSQSLELVAQLTDEEPKTLKKVG